MDRIIKYASSDMQNWQFKEEIKNFKEELLKTVNFNSNDYQEEVNKKTDEFLAKHKISLELPENEIDD